MEKPEVIEKKIEELKKQLQESKRYYKYELICDRNSSDETIGFFDIGQAKKILTLLNDGKKLQYKHLVYGEFNVYMNPQRNGILVKNTDDSDLEYALYNGCSTVYVNKSPINENTIMSFIIGNYGEWYLDTENK